MKLKHTPLSNIAIFSLTELFIVYFFASFENEKPMPLQIFALEMSQSTTK